jgi:F0F1-type ATP synthase membrane subunit a
MNDTIQILIFIATIVIFVISALRKQKSKQQAEPSEFQEAIEELFGIPSTPNKAKVNVENQKDDKINTSAKRPLCR